MYDIDFIQRIFHLTCSEMDLEIPHSEICYDLERPFSKYYRYSQIERAIINYLDGVWNDKMLASWANHYLWILLGGCDYDNVREDLDGFGQFFRDVITNALDGLAFFEENIADDASAELKDISEFLESIDYIYKTRADWRAVYAPVGAYDTQYVVLVNDTQKGYMILSSDHSLNGYEDERFSLVEEDELVSLVKKLVEEEYCLYAGEEEDFFMEIEE